MKWLEQRLCDFDAWLCKEAMKEQFHDKEKAFTLMVVSIKLHELFGPFADGRYSKVEEPEKIVTKKTIKTFKDYIKGSGYNEHEQAIMESAWNAALKYMEQV